MGRRSTTNAESSEYESASEVQSRDIKKTDDEPIIVAYGNSKPEYQYVTDDDLSQEIKDKFSYSSYGTNKNKYGKNIDPTKADSQTLQQNTLDAMSPENRNWFFSQQSAGLTPQAHHLVAGKNVSAEASRGILMKYHIDINDPRNCIFLPNDENSNAIGPIHSGRHKSEYDRKVLNYLTQALDITKGESDEEVRQFLLDTLDIIKDDIYMQKLPLYHRHKVIA